MSQMELKLAFKLAKSDVIIGAGLSLFCKAKLGKNASVEAREMIPKRPDRLSPTCTLFLFLPIRLDEVCRLAS